MTSPPFNHTKLNWLRISILTMLWNREMYGIEIQKRLKFQGLNIGPGQLYPTLNWLETNGTLTSREEERVGANRKFYRTTESGKNLVIQYMMDIISLFINSYKEKFDFIVDEIKDLVEINQPGMVIVDLSHMILENFLTNLVPTTDPTTRYFLTSENEDTTTLLQYRIEHYNLDKIVRVLEIEKQSVSLPDSSVDLVLIIFTMHEDGTEWLIPEMARILKPSGKGVIIDSVLPLAESMILDLIRELAPAHSQMSAYTERLDRLLDENKFIVTNRRQHKEIMYLVVQKQN